MRSIITIVAVLLLVSLTGCATAFVKPIGSNRYQINAIGGVISTPDDNFTEKAQELCPRGFKVIERHGTSDLYGTIECE